VAEALVVVSIISGLYDDGFPASEAAGKQNNNLAVLETAIIIRKYYVSSG
jgi:hypothetical protein